MLDDIDRRLLTALQKNAHLTAQELGERLNLSPSQAGRRRQRLEAEGYIRGYHARLDPVQMGLNVRGLFKSIWALMGRNIRPALPASWPPVPRL